MYHIFQQLAVKSVHTWNEYKWYFHKWKGNVFSQVKIESMLFSLLLKQIFFDFPRTTSDF